MKNIPKHVAIIMDGNRRWARVHGKEIIFGHAFAVDHVVEPLVDEAINIGISCLTFWAWSTENWDRSKIEVDAIMTLFRKLFIRHIQTLHKKGARVVTIGKIEAFPEDIQQKIAESVELTKNNTRITVVFALNYGGRDEIVRAINNAYSNAKFQMTNDKFTEEDIEKNLDTHGLPLADLIIRPGGERRLSGFLLWQSAYAELYFTDVLFPDFSPEELQKAVADFQSRERRYGK